MATLLLASGGAQAQWSVEILEDVNAAATAVTNGQVVGVRYVSGDTRPRVWTLTGGSWVATASSTDGAATGVDGAYQSLTIDGVNSRTQAAVSGWNGAAFPARTSLHPGAGWQSAAHAIAGDTIVGSYDQTAWVWVLGATTYTDSGLPDPVGVSAAGTVAYATDGVVHGGSWGDLGDNNPRACVWTPTGAVDLHPAGENESVIRGISKGQYVGSVERANGIRQAAVWTGTNQPVFYLTNTPWYAAEALAVHNGIQVGYTDEVNEFEHAFAWSSDGSGGTVDPGFEPTNLHTILDTAFPGEFIASRATGIWNSNGVVYICGEASNGNGVIRPILWTRQIDCNCPGNFYDLDEPCVLNFFDVQAFLAAYSNQDPQADLYPVGAPDGIFDFFDVAQFLIYYGQGCEP